MNFICGINPVLEALGAATRHFDRLLVVKGLRNKRISEAITRASKLGVPLRFEGRETLDRMSGGVPHQGIIALVSEKPLLELEELLGNLRDPALLVALDGVEDPRNLGAILRTCEAAGADGVLLPQRRTAGLSEVVNRASAGALEHVRVARIGNLSQALEALKARGVWVIGCDAAGRERWDQVDYKRPVALVMGGEGRGIRRLVRERCDHVVSLPMFGHVSSLNVSVAVGIALYEVVRQRGVVPSHVRPIPAAGASSVSPRVFGPRADDDERDPGDLRPPASDELDAASPDDDETTSHSVVQIHEEEAAWAGPQVLKAKLRARGRFQQRPERGRRPKGDRRAGPAQPGEPAREPAAAPRPPAHADAAPSPTAPLEPEKRGRRRKRRRGARREDAPAAGGRPDDARLRDAASAAPRDEAAPAPEKAAVPAGAKRDPARRTHRRRRQRH